MMSLVCSQRWTCEFGFFPFLQTTWRAPLLQLRPHILDLVTSLFLRTRRRCQVGRTTGRPDDRTNWLNCRALLNLRTACIDEGSYNRYVVLLACLYGLNLVDGFYEWNAVCWHIHRIKWLFFSISHYKDKFPFRRIVENCIYVELAHSAVLRALLLFLSTNKSA